MVALPWGRRASGPPVQLVCYTKPGCCLCDRARTALDRLERRGLVTVDYVSIVGIPELETTFGTRIPVVMHGADVVAETKVSEIWLERRLAGSPVAASRT